MKKAFGSYIFDAGLTIIDKAVGSMSDGDLAEVIEQIIELKV